jgi:serine/threonine protein kinase
MLTSGSKLGPYEIPSPLGAGGMGEVYRALDTRLDRTVAISTTPTEQRGNSCSERQWFVHKLWPAFAVAAESRREHAGDSYAHER